MASEKFANNSSSTLNGAINDSTTSVVVASAASFPSSGQFRIIVDSEIMLVTGVAGATFTVTRGAESTTPASHASLTSVTHILTAAGLAQTITDNVATISNAYAACTVDTVFNSAAWADIAGCGVSLTAGTWLVVGTATINNAGANTTAALKLYYGSTDLIAIECSIVAGFNFGASLATIVVLGSTQSVILAGRQQAAQQCTALRFGDPNTGAASITGTAISAIRLAL